MLNDFTKNGHILFRLPAAHTIKPYFDSLTVDPYYGSYRYKAVSRFNFIDNKVIMLLYKAFFQSKTYNPVAGDVIRDYPPIDYELLKAVTFLICLKKYQD